MRKTNIHMCDSDKCIFLNVQHDLEKYVNGEYISGDTYYCAMPFEHFVNTLKENFNPANIHELLDTIDYYRSHKCERMTYHGGLNFAFIDNDHLIPHIINGRKFCPIKSLEDSEQLYAIMNPLELNENGKCIFYQKNLILLKNCLIS